MTITDLRQQPQHLPLLAGWHHSEWGYLSPDLSLEQRQARMELYLLPGFVPSTWLATTRSVKGEPVVQGSAAIVASDMDTHPELSPWLASVYVAEAHRRQGVGSALVRHVMQQARLQGIKTLYLFTPNQAPLYARLGWEVLSEERYRGTEVTVMRARLAG